MILKENRNRKWEGFLTAGKRFSPTNFTNCLKEEGGKEVLLI
jgi:hypothetical protein